MAQADVVIVTALKEEYDAARNVDTSASDADGQWNQVLQVSTSRSARFERLTSGQFGSL